MTGGMEIRCSSCGSLNRVPENAAGKTVVCGKCKSPLPAGDGDGHPVTLTVTLTDGSFAGAIGSGSYVVDFWAPWCGPCRMIAPILDQLAAERRDVRFGKLNVDENPRTAAAFNARSIPLLVFFKDGSERGRVVGAVPRGHIEAAIKQYLG
jgi:thioredoxin